MTQSNDLHAMQPDSIDTAQRERLIAELAYYRAEKRGFKGGEQEMVQDWLEAEREIDKMISGELSGDGNPTQNEESVTIVPGTTSQRSPDEAQRSPG